MKGGRFLTEIVVCLRNGAGFAGGAEPEGGGFDGEHANGWRFERPLDVGSWAMRGRLILLMLTLKKRYAWRTLQMQSSNRRTAAAAQQGV